MSRRLPPRGAAALDCSLRHVRGSGPHDLAGLVAGDKICYNWSKKLLSCNEIARAKNRGGG